MFKTKPKNKLTKRSSKKSPFSGLLKGKSAKNKAPTDQTTPVTTISIQATKPDTARDVTLQPLPRTTPTRQQPTPTVQPILRLDSDSSEDSTDPGTATGTATGTGIATGNGGRSRTRANVPTGFRPAASKKKPVHMQGDLDLRQFAEDYGSQTRIYTRINPKHQGKLQTTVDALTRNNIVQITEDDLVAAIDRLGDLVDQLAVTRILQGPVDATDVTVASDIRQMMDVLDDLDGLLTEVVNPTTAPYAQLRELADFLGARPGLAQALRDRKVGIVFNSNGAKGQGGGVLLKGNIHLLGGEAEAPDALVRLIMHESGHATYQRLVMPVDMPTLPNSWDTGANGELRRRLATLQAAATDQGVPLNQSPFAVEAATIRATLDSDPTWDALSADAQSLYEAWLTLRANNGEHLLGLDLGAAKGPAARRKYQADNFKEFLAETFMQATNGTIKAHHDGIQLSPTASPQVKAAWRTTAAMIDKYAARQVLGVNSVF